MIILTKRYIIFQNTLSITKQKIGHTMNSLKKIETSKAPKAIGPYSQAVIAGDYMFVSGQIALDPSIGKLVDGGIKEQTAQTINNIVEILATKKLGLDSVVKTEVYLQNMSDFKEMNDVYSSKFLAEIKPARQAVEVAALPLGALVEISCIVFLGNKN